MSRAQISEGVKKIAWSYVFIYFHFNLGTIDILPDWWGYILILKGIEVLKDDEPSIYLLKPLGMMLAVYNVLIWLVKILGISLDIPLIGIIINVLLLYFNFQLLTNIADIAKRYDCREEKKIRKLIIIRTIISAIGSAPVNWLEIEWAVYAIGISTLIIALWTGILLFCLRDSLREGIDGDLQEN
ncbi:MAG: hypothetical protein IKM61_06110 [Eubacteriaceae bacterium]|nr:hypothetical protein [Eubacteriaceae bacterium]